MKKTLLTLAVASVCLAGCGKKNDQLKKKVIDGKEVIAMVGDTPIYADDIADKLMYNAEGAELIYSELTKLVTKLVFPITADINSSASVQLEQFKDQVSDTAAANGTTYDDELKSALTSEGVSSLNELEEKYRYNLQRSKLEEKYWDEKEDSYYESYIESALPYHVSHYLFSLGEPNAIYSSDTISETQAKKLANVIKDLGDKKSSFDSIANDASNGSADSGSAANGGDLGIMDVYSNYVSEFIYSVLMADYYFNLKADSQLLAKVPSSKYISVVNSLLETDYYGKGVNLIPFSVAQKLLDYASDTTYQVQNETRSKTYARNILLNEYLNNPGLSVIYFDEEPNADANEFVEITVNGESKKVLTKEGKIVLVTRSHGLDSSSGIHFILMEQSPFKVTTDNDVTNVTLNTEYFGKDGGYVNYYGEDKEKETKQTLEDRVKLSIEFGKANSTTYLNMDLFMNYLEEGANNSIVINGKTITISEKIVDLLEDYLITSSYYAREDSNKALTDAANSYGLRLNTFDSYKNDKYYVPVTCIDAKVTYGTSEQKACTYQNGHYDYRTVTGED